MPMATAVKVHNRLAIRPGPQRRGSATPVLNISLPRLSPRQTGEWSPSRSWPPPPNSW